MLRFWSMTQTTWLNNKNTAMKRHTSMKNCKPQGHPPPPLLVTSEDNVVEWGGRKVLEKLVNIILTSNYINITKPSNSESHQKNDQNTNNFMCTLNVRWPYLLKRKFSSNLWNEIKSKEIEGVNFVLTMYKVHYIKKVNRIY